MQQLALGGADGVAGVVVAVVLVLYRMVAVVVFSGFLVVVVDAVSYCVHGFGIAAANLDAATRRSAQ